MARRSGKGKYLSSGQLADEIGVSQSLITSYATSGKLVPAFTTPGGQYRWDLEDVQRQLQELSRKQREDRP